MELKLDNMFEIIVVRMDDTYAYTCDSVYIHRGSQSTIM